jgi:hypothetical protein
MQGVMFAISKFSLKWILIGVCLLCLSLQITHAQGGTTDPGYLYVKEAGLPQILNLSQTEDDITATLYSVYADENRVVVEYSVSTVNPEDVSTLFPSLQLRDSSGVMYEVFGGGGSGSGTSSGIAAFTILRVGENWQTIDGHFFITITAFEGMTFDFEVNIEVQSAVRVLLNEISNLSGVSLHLNEVSVSQSMTTATICYEMPASLLWMPRGTIAVPSDSLSLRNFPLPEVSQLGEETCLELYGFIPYRYAESDPQPITLNIVELATPRLHTLDNLTELQTRGEALGVTVTIIDTGDPINYDYWAANATPEFAALVDDLLFDHIAGHWAFQIEGLP